MNLIPILKPYIARETLDQINKVLSSYWIGEGPKVREFEKSIAEYIGNPMVVATNSCTSALQLALRLSGVREGDEVITTPMTCVATNMPILLARAKPIWADVDPISGNINPKSIQKRITQKTKAIIAVDWGGLPCDYEDINDIADRYGIPVIEDAAHSFGAEYLGRKIGSQATYTCFSFQAVKTITSGDGGAIVCKNENDYERAIRLNWYGIGRKNRNDDYDIYEPGYKFTMNDITASIGLAQLQHLDNLLELRYQNAEYYNQELANVPGITINSFSPEKESTNWLYTILAENRDDLIKYLYRNRIESSLVHKRNDQYKVFFPYRQKALNGLENFSKKMVCIPVGHWVGEKDLMHIVKVIKKGWK